MYLSKEQSVKFIYYLTVFFSVTTDARFSILLIHYKWSKIEARHNSQKRRMGNTPELT